MFRDVCSTLLCAVVLLNIIVFLPRASATKARLNGVLATRSQTSEEARSQTSEEGDEEAEDVSVCCL